MKDRIAQFLVNENISSAEFADKIGVQRSSVSHVLNGRNYPSTSFIQKMLSFYKNLNPRWLILGEGQMFSSLSIADREPSLFSYTQGDYILNAKSNASKPETISDKTISKDTLEHQKESSQNQSELIHEVHEIVDKTFDNKEVEQIVFFCRDKTFTVYTPSK